MIKLHKLATLLQSVANISTSKNVLPQTCLTFNITLNLIRLVASRYMSNYICKLCEAMTQEKYHILCNFRMSLSFAEYPTTCTLKSLKLHTDKT